MKEHREKMAKEMEIVLNKMEERKLNVEVSCKQEGGTPKRKSGTGEQHMGCNPAKRVKTHNFSDKLSFFKTLENPKKQHQEPVHTPLGQLNLLWRGESVKRD